MYVVNSLNMQYIVMLELSPIIIPNMSSLHMFNCVLSRYVCCQQVKNCKKNMKYIVMLELSPIMILVMLELSPIINLLKTEK